MNTPAASEWTGRVQEVIRGLDRGEVVSYGEVAAEAGRPGAARAVGNILAGSVGLPWWRVVTASGRLVPGNETDHAKRLRDEGVEVRGHRVAGFGRRHRRASHDGRPPGR
jgi:methylated-DNA-protein-cysteine methyltransferase-like protein